MPREFYKLGFSPAALLVSLVERPLETYNRSEGV